MMVPLPQQQHHHLLSDTVKTQELSCRGHVYYLSTLNESIMSLREIAEKQIVLQSAACVQAEQLFLQP